MATDKQIKQFTTDLRRFLYITTIMKHNIEWMKMGELTPSYMMVDLSNMNNCINRIWSNMSYKSTPETWAKVKCELSKDEINDISLLLDCVADVTNVAEIITILNEAKVAS